jgi:hypothetical protein
MSHHKLWSYSILEIAEAVLEEKPIRSYVESAFALAEYIIHHQNKYQHDKSFGTRAHSSRKPLP